MAETFAESARRVVALAQEEARLLKHGYIGTEHLLLGLLAQQGGVASEVLGSFSVTLDAARQRVADVSAPGAEEPVEAIPFTRHAEKVIELGQLEAQALGHSEFDTAHMLLGLVRESEGAGARVCVALGAEPDEVRLRVLRLLAPGDSELAEAPTGAVTSSAEDPVGGTRATDVANVPQDASQGTPADDDRVAVAEALERAVGQGQLNLDEYGRRLDTVYQAGSHAELAALTDDLVPVVGSLPPTVSRSVALFDHVFRTGNWRLPAQSQAIAVFSDVELDLREVTTTSTEVRIKATAVFGDVRITVPEGVEVVLESDAVLSQAHTCELAAVPRRPGTPLITVCPEGWFGNVRVESRRPHEQRLSTPLRERWRRRKE